MCSRTGTAVVRETSDPAWMRGERDVSVITMPDRFTAVSRKGSPFDGAFDVDCAEHGVSAIGNA